MLLISNPLEEVVPSSTVLMRFCNIVDTSDELQSQVMASKSAEEIIEIAASNGCNISLQELRFWSRELKAPYFPWAEKGNEWRRNFFSY